MDTESDVPFEDRIGLKSDAIGSDGELVSPATWRFITTLRLGIEEEIDDARVKLQTAQDEQTRECLAARIFDCKQRLQNLE